ncbi:unnamed protein product [Orchesella dallaii]|uniref:Uncharacterized protein n=1 Tax=Orchesella dallaii TaxID=48710 RepID=A0ABP1R0N3_9HEXA
MKEGKLRFSKSEAKTIKFLCRVLVVIEALTPFLIGIGCGLMPCAPTNLVVPLNPSCKFELNGEYDLKSFPRKCVEFIVQSTLNGLFWKAAVGAGTLWVIHILVGCKSQCLVLENMRGRVEVYRNIQLLSTLFNETYVGTLFVIIGAASGAVTSFSYTILKIYTSSVHFPIAVILWILMIIFDSAVIMLYVCKLGGSVNAVSKRVLRRQFSTLSVGRTSNFERRVLVSCSTIKVSFGLSNFIENDTPLKFIDFSVNRFVDLVLMN